MKKQRMSRSRKNPHPREIPRLYRAHAMAKARLLGARPAGRDSARAEVDASRAALRAAQAATPRQNPRVSLTALTRRALWDIVAHGGALARAAMAELERRDDALRHRNPRSAQKNPGWRELSSLYEIPGDVFVFDLYLHRVNYGMSPFFPSRADANAWWAAKRAQMPGVRAVLRVGKRARRNPCGCRHGGL